MIQNEPSDDSLALTFSVGEITEHDVTHRDVDSVLRESDDGFIIPRHEGTGREVDVDGKAAWRFVARSSVEMMRVGTTTDELVDESCLLSDGSTNRVLERSQPATLEEEGGLNIETLIQEEEDDVVVFVVENKMTDDGFEAHHVVSVSLEEITQKSRITVPRERSLKA